MAARRGRRAGVAGAGSRRGVGRAHRFRGRAAARCDDDRHRSHLRRVRGRRLRGNLGIRRLYEDAVSEAEVLVYIETQYITSRALHEALIARLEDRAKPPLQVIIVVPRGGDTFKEELALGAAEERFLASLEQAVAGTADQLRVCTAPERRLRERAADVHPFEAARRRRPLPHHRLRELHEPELRSRQRAESHLGIGEAPRTAGYEHRTPASQSSLGARRHSIRRAPDGGGPRRAPRRDPRGGHAAAAPSHRRRRRRTLRASPARLRSGEPFARSGAGD